MAAQVSRTSALLSLIDATTKAALAGADGVQIKHEYASSEEAIRALVELQKKIEARDFDTALGNSEGDTQRKIAELLAELNSCKQLMATIVLNTREMLRFADEGFRAADAKAESIFSTP
jgi:hypothetical protein